MGTNEEFFLSFFDPIYSEDESYEESYRDSVPAANKQVDNLFRVLFAHLLKLKYSPAKEYYNHWRIEVKDFRNSIMKVLKSRDKRKLWSNVVNHIIANWNDLLADGIREYNRCIDDEPNANLPDISNIIGEINPLHLYDILNFDDSNDMIESELDRIISVLPELEV